MEREGPWETVCKSCKKIVNGKQKGERKRPLSPSSPSPFLPPYHPLSPISPFPLKERVQDGLAALALSFISIHDSARYARACPLFHWRYIMSMHLALRESTGRREKPEDKSEEGMAKACRHKSIPRFPLGRSARAHARSEAPIPPCIYPSPRGMEGGAIPQPACLWGRRPPPRGGPGAGRAWRECP